MNPNSTNEGESTPLLAGVKLRPDEIGRDITELQPKEKYGETFSNEVEQTTCTRLRRRYSDFGSVEANDLLNFDPDTGVPVARRASVSGCVADIGELTSHLPKEKDLLLRKPSESSSANGSTEETATYWKLFRNNIPFTLYILSYFSAHAGEWFTYVAQLTAVKHISSESQTSVSILVAIRMVPNVLFASFGGALADAMDRRVAMIALDVMGMFVVLLYLPILHYESLALLYVVAFVQATVAAIYDPLRQSIVPLLVPEADYLKKATTITGLAWSVMAAVGASLGGIVVSSFGMPFSFKVDSLTYLLSAVLMWLVDGEWSVAEEKTTKERRASLSFEKMVNTYKSMTVDGISYLTKSSFAIFVLIKASGALSFGSTDVLNVTLSHVEGDEKGDSKRLGILFGVMGLGCLVGPLVAEKFIEMREPRSMLSVCVIGYAFISAGFVGIGISSTFTSVCIATFIRGIGSSVMWVNSTLLLQKFSAKEKLGRVLSVDYSLCTLVLALSAFAAGYLEDHAHMTPEQISWIMAILGLASFFTWGTYLMRGGGPAGISSTIDREEP